MRNGLIGTFGALWVIVEVVMFAPAVGAVSVSASGGSQAEAEMICGGLLADLTADSVAVAPEVVLAGYRLMVELASGESAGDFCAEATYAAESTLVVGAERIPTGEWPLAGSGQSEPLPRSGGQPVEVLGVVELAGSRWLEFVIYPVVVGADSYRRRVQELTLSIGDREVSSTELRPVSEAGKDLAGRASLAASGFEAGGWVVVTSQSLAPAFADLVAHRRALGLTAQVVTIDSIIEGYAGVDDAARLKAFCGEFYEQGGVYVLLAGDETVLPVRYAFPYDVDEAPDPEYFQICDLYFADLDGDWDADGDGIYGERLDDEANLIPEILVGRLPISNYWEAQNYVEKVITYETNPGHGESEYLTRSFFFSSDQMRDYSNGGQHGRIAAAFPAHVLIDTVNGVELASGEDANPTNQSAPELAGLMREGWGIINVIAHGRSDAFAVRTSGFNNWPKSYLMSEPLGPGHGAAGDLAGCGKAGFVYSLACDNAAFDKDQPPFNLPGRNLSQDLLAIADGGAVGMVAYSRWGWVATSHYLQKYFFDSLFAHPELPAIEAMYASHRAYPYCRDLLMGQLYLGDPALRIYTEQPQHLVGDVTIAEGRFRARFTDREGIPAVNTAVLLSDTGGVLQQLTTDLDGWVTLPEDLGLGQTYYLAMRGAGTTAAVFGFVPGLVTDVADEPVLRPERFVLHQNYPNPFNPTTIIAFDLDRRGHTTLAVFNLLGQRVATLIDGELGAGIHEAIWDGATDVGTRAGSGVYFYRLESGAQVSSRKMVLLK